MFKTLRFSFFILFTLASLAARGQFSAGDRAHNIGLWLNYSEYDATNSRLSGQLNPQMSLFTSPHFSIGLGMSFYYTHDKYGVDFNPIFWTVIYNRLDFKPQLLTQYYQFIHGNWYASLKLQVEPSEVTLTRSTIIDSTGKKIKTKIQANKNDYFVARFRPIIGYHVSEKWLIELEFANLNFSRYVKTSSNYNHRDYTLDFTFNPSQFTFRWIYLVPSIPLSIKNQNKEKSE